MLRVCCGRAWIRYGDSVGALWYRTFDDDQLHLSRRRQGIGPYDERESVRCFVVIVLWYMNILKSLQDSDILRTTH